MTDVILLAFGGPERREDVAPFLDRVLSGRRIPEQRYQEVVCHYKHLGGSSPFNELTRRQAAALSAELAQRGIAASVRVAFRHAPPYIEEVAQELASRPTQPVAVIMVAHQSEASWDKYYGSIPKACYTAPFFDHPLFVQAHAERLREALQRVGITQFNDVPVLFTAHSIPQAVADRGPYVTQLHKSAELIAAYSGASQYHIAYQSRSGSPYEAWLEPDVRDSLVELAHAGTRLVVVSPIGFLCDHVEVLYDLDVEAAAVARAHDIRMVRAQALNDHPLFIAMLADVVEQCLA